MKNECLILWFTLTFLETDISELVEYKVVKKVWLNNLKVFIELTNDEKVRYMIILETVGKYRKKYGFKKKEFL